MEDRSWSVNDAGVECANLNEAKIEILYKEEANFLNNNRRSLSCKLHKVGWFEILEVG